MKDVYEDLFILDQHASVQCIEQKITQSLTFSNEFFKSLLPQSIIVISIKNNTDISKCYPEMKFEFEAKP